MISQAEYTSSKSFIPSLLGLNALGIKNGQSQFSFFKVKWWILGSEQDSLYALYVPGTVMILSLDWKLSHQMYSSPGNVIFHVASQASVVSVTSGNASVSVKQKGLYHRSYHFSEKLYQNKNFTSSVLLFVKVFRCRIKINVNNFY